MEDSEEEEDDDTAERMDTCGEAPNDPPAGYKYAACPLTATATAEELEVQQRALCGSKILAAHILDGATGWYMGMIQNFGVGPAWKQPDATHIVLYKKSETRTKDLNGRVACKLAVDNYGANEWWLLLEPV